MSIFGKKIGRTLLNVFNAGAVRKGEDLAVIERLACGMNNINGLELLEVIARKSAMNPQAYEAAVNTFLSTDAALSPLSAQQKLDIVAALSLKRMFCMFEDWTDDLREIFRAASAEQKKDLLSKDLFEFFAGKKSIIWQENDEILSYLADLFVDSLEEYAAQTDPVLGQYLVDNFGLERVFESKVMAPGGKSYIYDNHAFVVLTDYASEAGIRKLLEEAGGDSIAPSRLRTLEEMFYLKDKKALALFVAAKGCFNDYVETYLIVTGELPEANIKRSFVFPKNFSLLMDTLGAAKVAELFPDEMKNTMPHLWRWVQTNRSFMDIEGFNAKEREYLLSDDKLNRAYMAAGGTYSEADIRTLSLNGKAHIVAESRGKKK